MHHSSADSARQTVPTSQPQHHGMAGVVGQASPPPSIWLGLGRLVRLLGQVVRGMWLVHMRFHRMDDAMRQHHTQQWAAGVVRSCGLCVQVQGAWPPASAAQGLLLISNHLSWVDIPILQSVFCCRFVSKAEVQHWPLLGRMAAAAGTVWLNRTSRRDAQRVRECMVQQLRHGHILAIFPEGTTSDGQQLLPFHGNLLQAAIDAQVPIQPVALRFADACGQASTAPCYVGDETLLTSVWRTLCSPGLVVHVSVGELQYAGGRHRRQWAQELHATVEILRQLPDTPPPISSHRPPL